jgi:NAD dependent epimerase/dehydratase family enzyme
LIERGIEDVAMNGVYVASAPNPVPQVEFMRELRRTVGMPIGLPATAWMLRFACRFLLRTDPELALYGRFVVSKRLEKEGFEFVYPRIRKALGGLFPNPKQSTLPGKTVTEEKCAFDDEATEGTSRCARAT